MTFLLYLTVISYSTIQLYSILNDDDTQFTSSSHINDLTDISQLTFDTFDDSFNLMLDIRNETFDWFDNPYISPNVYYLDQTWKPKLHETVRMKKCVKEELLKIVPE